MGPHSRAISGVKAKLLRRVRAIDPSLAQQIANLKLDWFKVIDAEPATAPAEAEPADPTINGAEIFIYDEIGGSFGVDANELVMAINELDADEIAVRINSPGGSVFDAISIYNALIRHPANVVVYVDSLAASAASIIAMSGNEVVMMPGAQLMIHDAIIAEQGNEAELNEAAKFVGRQSDNIAGIYAARAGELSEVDWRAAMRAETWLFAGEAVDIGLADRVYTPPARVEIGKDVDPLGVPEEEVEPETPGEQEPETPGEEEPENLLRRKHILTNRGYKYAGRERAPQPEQPRTASMADLYGHRR